MSSGGLPSPQPPAGRQARLCLPAASHRRRQPVGPVAHRADDGAGTQSLALRRPDRAAALVEAGTAEFLELARGLLGDPDRAAATRALLTPWLDHPAAPPDFRSALRAALER